jgi:ABC-type Fe3+ transport system permease subunit/DNA-binding beta-propeller fold protein YncE
VNWTLFQNSLEVAFTCAALATLVGGACAIAAAGATPRLRNTLVVLAVIALVLPPFLVANTWLQYFGLTGTWRPYLNFDIYSLPGTIFLITVSLWPVPFLLVLGALFRIQPIYLEQEPLLRGWLLVKHLIWPTCRGTIAFAFTLSFILALNNFSVPVLLQTKVYTEEVWLAFSTRFDYIAVLKLSWPLVLTPLLLVAVFRFNPARHVFRTRDFPAALFRHRAGVLFPFAVIITFLAVTTSVLIPSYQLLANSRTWSEFIPAISAGRNAAANSLLFAVLPAVCIAALAQISSRRKLAWSWIFFLAPGVLVGISLIWLLNRPPLTLLYQSIGVVLLAYLIRFFALGWTSARVAQSAADNSLREVVALSGGNLWQQFRLAEWPQTRRVLLASTYLLYLLCLWEVETLLLIVPPGRETLALRVFNMLHYGHAGQVDALCLWLIIFALAPLTFAALPQLRRVLPGAIVFVLLFFAPGCSESSANTDHLHSKLFAAVQVIGSRGTGAGQFNKPRSVAVDRNDNLYVVDLTGRVQKFSPDGQYLLAWQMPQTDKGKPKGMVKDADGNVIVVEPHYSRVNHFDPNGKLLAQWGENGTNESKLQVPRSVAVNSKGEIYISEYGLVERIQRFSHHGTRFIQAFGNPGTAPGELNRAEGLGIGPDDSLFVADSCNHRIQVFSADGKFLESFGHAGTGSGELSYPYDVRVDRDGNRYVCEFGNSRIQIFDAQNRPLEILGGAGMEPGQLNNPWAIALDSHGNLYVADSANHRVQKFIRRAPFAAAAIGGSPKTETHLAQLEATR